MTSVSFFYHIDPYGCILYTSPLSGEYVPINSSNELQNKMVRLGDVGCHDEDVVILLSRKIQKSGENTTWDVKKLTIKNGISTISTDAGFLNHQEDHVISRVKIGTPQNAMIDPS